MLQQLRVASKSWVASVIIGILVLAFALWGVADIFHGGADTVVAEVGKSTISSADYDRDLKDQIRVLSEQTKSQITMDQAKAIGLDRGVLDGEISRTAVDEEGHDLGLAVSRAAIASQIQNDQNFFGDGGAFDANAFARFLQDNGFSEAAYVSKVGDDLARNQLIDAITDGMAAPPGMTRLLYDFTNEQRTVEYLVLTPDAAGAVPEPTATDLESYYKAHAADFTAPEYRTFDYVEIGPSEVTGIEVSDADIKAQYDSHLTEYGKPETRDIQQIVFPTKEAADAAEMRLKSGTDFVAIAHERGLKDPDINLGIKAASDIDPQLAQAVFSVPEGSATAPIQGPFGWVILRATKINKAETQSLESVRDSIKADLTKARAAGKVTDLVNAFEDARGSGAGLSEAAMKVGLTVHHVASSDRMGMTPEGAKADIPMQDKFLDQMFMTEPGEESETFQTDDGQNYAVKIDSVTPPAVKPLASVREEVRDDFIKEARGKLLLAKVKALADMAMKDGNLTAIGKLVGHAPIISPPMTRNKPDDIFSANLTGQLFATPPGMVLSGPEGKGDGYVIARVTKVTHPDPNLSSPEYNDFRKAAAEQLDRTTVDALAGAARLKVGVNIHQATLTQVLGGTAQQ